MQPGAITHSHTRLPKQPRRSLVRRFIGVTYGLGVAHHFEIAALKPRAMLAQSFDLLERMADHYDRGLVVGEHFVYATLALFLKLEVAHGKYLVNYKYIVIVAIAKPIRATIPDE